MKRREEEKTAEERKEIRGVRAKEERGEEEKRKEEKRREVVQ